jgi:hypothetical protein
MTSVCGHVFGLDFLSKFNNWDRTDPAELFICQTEKKETTPKLKMPNFLSSEAKGCDYLVLWLDCDKVSMSRNGFFSTLTKSWIVFEKAFPGVDIIKLFWRKFTYSIL